MNSALSVPWGAVGCRDNRGITLLQLFGHDRHHGHLARRRGPDHRLGNTRLRRPLRRRANLHRAAEARMVAVTQNRPYAFTVVDAGSYSIEAGSDAAVTIPTHSGISRHLDLNAECDRIQLERDRSDCDDRDPNESWGGSVAVALSPTGRVRVE